VAATDILDVGVDVANVWAGLRADLRRTGNLISDNDLIIAATALFHGLTLGTRNVRHFARIPNLAITNFRR